VANLNEFDEWTESIYRLEPQDPIVGGENGPANLQAKQLANRTVYLKHVLERLEATGFLSDQPTLVNIADRTFTKVVVNAKGLVISGDNITFNDIGGTIYPIQLPSATETSKGGVTISDSVNSSSSTTAASSKAVKYLNSTKLSTSGGTLSGKTEIIVTPIDPNDVTNVAFVNRTVATAIHDTLETLAVKKTGDDVPGIITIIDPSQPRQIVNKHYVDDNFVPISGDTLIHGKLSTDVSVDDINTSADYITKGYTDVKLVPKFGNTKIDGYLSTTQTKFDYEDQYVNKGYVDTEDSKLVPKFGNTKITGKLSTTETNFSEDSDYVTKGYVDTEDSKLVPKHGDTTVDGYLSTTKDDFTSDDQYVNRGYVSGNFVPKAGDTTIIGRLSTTETIFVEDSNYVTKGYVDSTITSRLANFSNGSTSFSLVTDGGYVPFFPDPINLIGVNNTPENIVYAASKVPGTTQVKIWKLEKVGNNFTWTPVSTTPPIVSSNFNQPGATFISRGRMIITHGDGVAGNPAGIWHIAICVHDCLSGNLLINSGDVFPMMVEAFSGVIESSDGNFIFVMDSGTSHLMKIQLSDLTHVDDIDVVVPGEPGSNGGDYIDGCTVTRISDSPDIALVMGGHGTGSAVGPYPQGFVVNLVDKSRRLTAQNPNMTMYGTGIWLRGEYYNFTGHTNHDDPIGTLVTNCAKWTASTNVWTTLTPIPRAIKYPRSFVFNNGVKDFIIVMGGEVVTAGTFMKNPTIYFYDIVGNSWYEFPNQNEGWSKHSNGLIEQWGEWFPKNGDYTFDVGDADFGGDVYQNVDVVFPIPFPNQCVNQQCTINYIGGWAGVGVPYVGAATKTGMKIHIDVTGQTQSIPMKRSPLDDSSRLSYMWRAIGY
jgi:hypothetical protein